MEVRGRLHVPAALLQGKYIGYALQTNICGLQRQALVADKVNTLPLC
jgi:hypothetical protein